MQIIHFSLFYYVEMNKWQIKFFFRNDAIFLLELKAWFYLFGKGKITNLPKA